MRKLLFASLLLSTTASAEVIKCPDIYPNKEIILPNATAGQNGGGILRGAKLSTAFIDTTHELHGYPYGGFDAMVSVGKKVKDGEDIETNFSARDTKRWLVCVYGGNELRDNSSAPVIGPVEWWARLNPRFTKCVLQIREVKKAYGSPSDWTATTRCK